MAAASGGGIMGVMRPPLPVKLFIGMLSPEPDLFDACAKILGAEFGPLDFESAILPWNKTAYYRDEMGPNILRKFLFFGPLLDPGRLPLIKKFVVDLEREYSVSADRQMRRMINLDPGYITEAKVVLATTKDFAHRIYIGENIYAEVTLRYSTKERRFVPHEYTYPDYKSEDYLALFHKARQNLRAALNKRQENGI